ncbi:hypothetical protein MNBD_PLANCTO03-1601 [hydrothermal vent metagenome]|uniref:Uncharacterized protein n=1 Tax=hydrothermal vent metagenome TaxID=652676 RepID=A0A3B1DMC9_9ZZZZ
MILLAFAIQLGPASARLDPSGVRAIECLRLCDGQLLPLWFADSGSTDAGRAEAVALTRLSVTAVLPGRLDAGHPLPGVARGQVGWAVLPMPPPAVF